MVEGDRTGGEQFGCGKRVHSGAFINSSATDMNADSDGLRGEKLACARGGRTVFEGLTLTVAPGAALILHGPNGSGKSSLLRILAGLLPPSEGTLTWRGEPVGDNPEAYHASLRYVGHADAIKPTLTVRENLAFWAAFYGGGGDAETGLDGLELGHLADIPARFLSAGQRRRLGLTRILAAPAPLWLLDEPTVTLDESAVATVETLIADHRGSGGMVVVATHAGIRIPGAEKLRPDGGGEN